MKTTDRRLLLGFLLVLAGGWTACSDDAAPPQEPVAASPEGTPYPEDPGLAQADKQNATPPPSEGDTPAAAEVTKDPFKDGQQNAAPSEAPPPPTDGPSVGDTAVEGSLEDNKATYSPTDAQLPPEEAAAPAHGKKGKHHKKAAAAKVARYVTAHLLNVRSKPSLKGAIVKHLKAGSAVNVELHGKWAKIKNGEWVRSKYLSETPPGQ